MLVRRLDGNDFRWHRTGVSNNEAQEHVRVIVNAVREKGDKALRSFSAQFDGWTEANETDYPLSVDPLESARAWQASPQAVREALSAAAYRIRDFHTAQYPEPVERVGEAGERMGMVWRPIQRVGVYAPGGRGAYPSTVLMNAIPAQVAGVQEVVLVSPVAQGSSLPHPTVLAAAHLLGIREIYRVGGAHSIAALTYGTSSIRPVDKIVGPGNLYVATAKKLVMGDVGIDSIAGPSEVFIVADENVPAQWIAADMLAQAEHDPEAGAVCLCTSKRQLGQVEAALETQLVDLPRADIARASLKKWGALVHVDSLRKAIDHVNKSCPEHVELLLPDADRWLPEINRAGAVFLGMHTPEPVGDYYAGTNHVLPTHGSARFASGLSVYDFLRHMTYVAYQEQALAAHAAHITELARTESLEAHARSLLVRFSRTGGKEGEQ